MLGEQRRLKILELIQEDGTAKVNALSKIFNVTEPTIRQDIKKLERDGFITRHHGGAMLKDISQHVETLTLQYQKDNYENKILIGKKASEFIKDGDSIILDSGSTTTEIAKNLSGKKDLTILTNALNIALLLGTRFSFQIVMTGGEFKAPTLSLTGEKASVLFQHVRINKLFLATAGISFTSGLSYPSFGDIYVKNAMIDCAEKIFLVADSTKMGKNAFATINRLEKIDYLITDSGITKEDKDQFKKFGIKVIVAE